MFCSNCGQELREDARFCGSCGNAVNGSQKKEEEAKQSEQRTSPKPINEKISFVTSYITFYLKGKIGIQNDHIDVEIPNTIFGLIPLGSSARTVDVNQIASALSNFKANPVPLVIGSILALDGLMRLCAIGDIGLAFLEMIVGTFLALNALQTTITISLTSGETIEIPLIIFEKSKADLIREKISVICATRTHDTNTRVHTEHQTSEIINALQNRA